MSKVYFLDIQLMGIKPKIWRRFMVPSTIRLSRLHEVIQIVMGWGDCHLYSFIIDYQEYTRHPEDYDDGLESSRYSLGGLIKQKGRTFEYVYDFGDSWRHKLKVLGIDDWHSAFGNPFDCLSGERACPPEDVGGVPGYYEFCEAMKNPNHDQHDMLMEWYGGAFDSEAFDVREVKRALSKFNTRSRKKSKL